MTDWYNSLPERIKDLLAMVGSIILIATTGIAAVQWHGTNMLERAVEEQINEEIGDLDSLVTEIRVIRQKVNDIDINVQSLMNAQLNRSESETEGIRYEKGLRQTYSENWWTEIYRCDLDDWITLYLGHYRFPLGVEGDDPGFIQDL